MIYTRSRTAMFITPVLCLLLLFSVFCLVRLRSSIVSVEYRIGELERLKVAAIGEQKALAAELASLRSIREVEQRDIALVFPDRRKVVHVESGGSGVRSVASVYKKR